MNVEELKVFYSPAERTIIDIAITVNGAWQQGLHCGRSELDLRLAHPDLMLVRSAEAIQLIEDSAITAPERIPLNEWIRALNDLPPVDFMNEGEWSHFKCSEHFTYGVTSIYVRHRARHYHFRDRFTLTAEEIRQKVRAFEESTTTA